MMGQGSYGYGGSSNLSALAPPFTVDRSIPKSGSNPLVDLTEPSYAVNWVSPNSRPDYFSISNPEFDSVAFSNAYRYSSSTAAHVPPLNPPPNDAILYGQSSSNLLEAKPYYPSFVSSAIGSDSHGSLGIHHHSGYDLLSTSHVATPNGSSNDDYTQSLSGLELVTQWSGLWEGLVDWQQSEQVQLDGSFCSNENFMNQGLYATESMSKYEEASHSIGTLGGENHTDSAGVGQLDYKFFLGENPQFMPTDYPTTSSSTSTLLVPETCPPHTPSLKAVNSWNHQMPYSASYEKCFKKNDATPSDTATVMNSSPAVAIRPPDTSSSRNMNPSNDEKNKDFGSNNPSVVKEPHPFICSKVGFDASQVSFHLEQNDQVVAEFSSGKNQEQPSSGSGSVSVDLLDHFAKEKCGIPCPHRSPDGFNLVVDKNEAINSVKNYTENLDNYNPAEDSPCWKGAPVSHFSQFEASEAVTSQNMKKLESCSGSNLQAHQIFTFSANDGVKISPEKPSENSIQHDGWSLENHLDPSWKRPLVANVLPREGIDDALKSGPHHTKPSCFYAVQISDDAVSNKSIDNSDHKPPYNDQQSCEGGKWTSEKNCTSGICVAGVEINMNDDPDHCSSHVPFHAIEHVLRSPPSADDAPTKLTKSHRGESTEKMYVRTLIDTMQNLSELLVFHFSTDACQLKEDDYEVLKEVINNLDLCILKNVGRMTSTQEPVIPQRAASQLLGKPPNLQKVENMNGSQVSRIDPPNSQAPFKYQHAQEDEHNTVSGKNDEKLLNFVSERAAADILKDDNMTQAIRKALTENFHGEEETEPQVILYKNLWLEAEASLCSASCMVRFSRMKREMEKCNSQNVIGLPENTVVMEKVSRSKVSTDPCTNKMLASDTKGSPLMDASILGSSILSTSRLADDVAARFHVLKNLPDSSSTSNTSGTSGVDKTLGSPELSSEISPNPVHVDKLACEDKVGQKPEISIQDSPRSSTNSQVDDVEASVMARFHILKCRVDNLNSVDREEHQRAINDLDNLNSVDREEHQRAINDLGYAGMQRHWPIGEDGSEDKILDVNKKSQSQNHAFNSAEDILTVKEFRLFVKDDPMIQSFMTNRPGDQSHAGIHDGSSDWEHVLLEELAG